MVDASDSRVLRGECAGPTLDSWLDDLAAAMARAAVRLIALAREMASIGNPNARSDATVGEMLARATLAAAVENVRANVATLSRPEGGRALLEGAKRLERDPTEGRA